MNSTTVHELLQGELIPCEDLLLDLSFTEQDDVDDRPNFVPRRSNQNSLCRTGSKDSENSTFQNLLSLQRIEFKKDCRTFTNICKTNTATVDNKRNPGSKKESKSKKNADHLTMIEQTIFSSCLDKSTTTQPDSPSLLPNGNRSPPEPIQSEAFIRTPTMSDSSCQFLGINYQPSNWDVICGRGRHSYNHIGNRRFRILIATKLPKYIEAKANIERYHVSNSILEKVDEASGGFVKQDGNGNWYKLGTRLAREKIAHTFRDSMTGQLRRKKSSITKENRIKLIHDAQDSIFQSCKIVQRSNAAKGKSKSAALCPTDEVGNDNSCHPKQ